MTSAACTCNPPERAVVLCVDEKSQIQALDRTRPILPMLPGTPERATHDYKRHGTSSLYAALGSRHRKVIGRLHEPSPRDRVPEVLANDRPRGPRPAGGASRARQQLARTRRRRSSAGSTQHPRFVLHFTPTSSSWLNLVERWFAELTTKLLRRGAHPHRPRSQRRHPRLDRELEREPTPYVWTKPAEQILESIARYCQRINQTGH